MILDGEDIGFKVVSKSLNPEAKELPLHLMFSVLLDDLASLDMSHIKTLESFPCFEDSDKLRSHHQLPCVDGITPRLVKSSLELLKDGLLSDVIPPLVDCLEQTRALLLSISDYAHSDQESAKGALAQLLSGKSLGNTVTFIRDLLRARIEDETRQCLPDQALMMELVCILFHISLNDRNS